MSDRSAGPLAACVRAAVRGVRRPPGPDADLLAAFVRDRDPAAFEQLVRRHAPLVLSACRHVLADPADADDACQATFVVLYRKAHTIRARQTLGGWLFRVARRAAVEVQRAANRRRKAEARAVRPEPVSGPDLSWREACAILHEELDRLPDKYRLPLIACYLEGKTQDEAARELGWSAQTVRGRIDRGRTKLGQRLRKRGVTLSAGLLVAATVSVAPAVGLPAVLSPSPTVAAVARAVTASGRAAFAFGGLSLAAGLVAGAVVLGAGSGDPPLTPPTKEAAKAAPRLDAFGDPLPDGAVARLGTVRFNHGDGLHGLVYARDGKTILSVGDGRARVWDAGTGAELRQFPTGITNWDEQIALSPDGKRLVYAVQEGGMDDRLREFEVASGKELRSLPLPVRRTGQSVAQPNALSLDGGLVAVWTRSVVRVFDVASGAALHTLPRKGDDLRGLCFAGPDLLVTAAADGKVEVWESRSGKPVRQFDQGAPAGVIAGSPDGKLLATLEHHTVSVDKFLDKDTVRVWDLGTGKLKRELTARPGRWFMRIGFSPDDKTVRAYSQGRDGREVTVWDAATGARVAELSGAPGQVMAQSPDGRRLAAGAEMGKFDVFDLATGKPMAPAEATGPWAGAVFLSRAGDRAITLGATSVTTWEVGTGRPLGSAAVPEHLFERPWCRFSPDGRYAVLVRGTEKDGSVVVWDLAAGKAVHTIPVGGPSYGVATAFSADSTRFAVRLPGKEPRVIVRDVTTGKELVAFKLPASDYPGHLFFADGARALVVTGKRTAAYRLSDGKELFGWKMDPEPLNSKHRLAIGGPGGVIQHEEDRLAWRTMVLSPDGALAACVLSAGWSPDAKLGDRIALCDARTGKAIRRWSDSGKQGRGFEAMTFSADGRLLATADGYDLHVWEAATGKEVRTFRGHRNEIESLAFSGNGRRLASGSWDSTVLIWDLSAPAAGDPADWWADLLSEDAATAYAAIWRLADAAEDVTIPLVRKHLRPVTAADLDTVRKAIADLDSDQFRVRDRAFKELSDAGYHAAPALRAALDGKPSAEARNRIEQLLAKVVGPPSSGESLRTWRALGALEANGSAGAKQLLRELSDGAAGAWLTEQAKASLRRLDAFRPQ